MKHGVKYYINKESHYINLKSIVQVSTLGYFVSKYTFKKKHQFVFNILHAINKSTLTISIKKYLHGN